MGQGITKVYDGVGHFYENYYPKSKYLRPAYVSSALMSAKILADLADLNRKGSLSQYNNFLFLSSSGITFGLQLWVSFVSGLTMMKILKRHEFGRVQSQLFPKYFFLTTASTFVSFTSFLRINPVNSWKEDSLYLGLLIGGSFVLNLINHLLVNQTLTYNIKMHEIERNAGIGLDVVGPLPKGTSVEKDLDYLDNKSRFYFFHGISMVTNFASFIATVAQFYYLSKRQLF